MMNILALSRTTVNPHLMPYSVQFFLIFLSVNIFTSTAHSRADSGSYIDGNHQHIVEAFKTKILDHMGWAAPPKRFNYSINSFYGKMIREYFRNKIRANDVLNSIKLNDRHGKYDDDSFDHPQTLIFPSTDSELWVQVPQTNTAPSTSELTTIKFKTNLHQPEIPYHYLQIKSAILRLSISRQKRNFRTNDIVNVSFYLLSPSHQISGENITSTLIYSVNNPTVRTIQFDIKPELLSLIVESDDPSVTIEIKAGTLPAIKDGGASLDVDATVSKGKNTQYGGQPEADMFRISKASLQVTSTVQDLRKSRKKRQTKNSPNCSENICCRHSIYVDFKDIGWSDWVLSPEGFTAYYCKGGCPNRYRVASSFTGIKSILHDMIPGVVPAPVCAPTDYNPLDMIIFDGAVKDVSFPGMLVSGCRCY